MTSSTSLLVLVGEKTGFCGTSLCYLTHKTWISLRDPCFKRWRMLTASLLSLGQVILYTFVISSLPSFHTSVTVE